MQRVVKYVSLQLDELSHDMRKQVEDAASGIGGVAESMIDYVIRDRSGAEIQTAWQDADYVTYDDIVNTSGYQALMHYAQDAVSSCNWAKSG